MGGAFLAGEELMGTGEDAPAHDGVPDPSAWGVSAGVCPRMFGEDLFRRVEFLLTVLY